MAPAQHSLACEAPGCVFKSATSTDLSVALDHLKLHVQLAHSSAGGPTLSKVEQRPRPRLSLNTSEHDFRFFASEWEDYKAATGLTGARILTELWSCMTDDLRHLAFDQGGRDNLTTEALMIAAMKELAVTELHSAMHTVSLHEAKQLAGETTRAFAARVKGIASNCSLSKTCPTAGCGTVVSFSEETVLNVVMAGLHDPDIRERALTAAYMKRIANLKQLVEFCSAEEATKLCNSSSIGAVRSSYKKEANNRKTNQKQAKPKCKGCGEQAHEDRSKQCKAWGKTCNKCNKSNHFSNVCEGGAQPPKRTQNAALNAPKVEEEQQGGDGSVQAYAFVFGISADLGKDNALAVGPGGVGTGGGTTLSQVSTATLSPSNCFSRMSGVETLPLQPPPTLCGPSHQPALQGAPTTDAALTPVDPLSLTKSHGNRGSALPGGEHVSAAQAAPLPTKATLASTGISSSSASQALPGGDFASSSQDAPLPPTPLLSSGGTAHAVGPGEVGTGGGTTLPQVSPIASIMTNSASPPVLLETDTRMPPLLTRGSTGTSAADLALGSSPLVPPVNTDPTVKIWDINLARSSRDATQQTILPLLSGGTAYATGSGEVGTGGGTTSPQVSPFASILTNIAYPPVRLEEAHLLASHVVSIPLCHLEYVERSDGTWGYQERDAPSSPRLQVNLAIDSNTYQELGLRPPSVSSPPHTETETDGIADTGAQMCICGIGLMARMGVDVSSLLRVKARVTGATRASKVDIVGGIFLTVTTKQSSTKCLFYVASNVSQTYLSLSALKNLDVVSPYFPEPPPKKILVVSAAQAQTPASLPPCSNSGVVTDGEKPCSCPKRALPPEKLPDLPCAPTPENLPRLKQFLLNHYADSAFNVCEHQPLPLLQNSPPLKLHVNPEATPRAVHKPATVPLHWHEAVFAGIQRDVRLGVLEPVPLNTPVGWQARMHITAKHDGSPRRTVDYQNLNSASPRQTHHTPSPWHTVASIPANVRKSTFDAFHGYHSLPLATEEDRDATTFITPWGRFRYRTCPQGFLSAGDAYTARMDAMLHDFERMGRCVDDTLLYDDSIEASFARACHFLNRCGQNGVILNPSKFQFAEEEVDFLGFTVTNTGVRPTNLFLDNILSFPTPTNLTDVRSWFGAVAQVSYAFASGPIMAPFKPLLSSKAAFSWSAELEAAFQESKKEIVRQCQAGVRAFDPNRATALATDWSKSGMGFWLAQKHCWCASQVPGCCLQGWQTVLVGSRFCTGAESRYSPICGEAAAAAWGAEKCKFFLLGHPGFTLALDHKPLLKIFSPNMELGDISNPRLYNQKVKLLPFRFTPAHIPGKKHVIPDCLSRKAGPVPPVKGEHVDLLDIHNIEPAYSSSEVSPPSWVSPPRLLAFLSANPLEQPTQGEVNDTLTQEYHTAVRAINSLASMFEDDEPSHQPQLASLRQAPVRLISWQRIQQAHSDSPLCRDLRSLLDSGLPEDRASWPANLVSFYPVREDLDLIDGVLCCKERPVIPPELQREALEHLHAAHHGTERMRARAAQTIFWPNMTVDIAAHKDACRGCLFRAPSQPAPLPVDPAQPDFPFQQLAMDFFQVDKTYLAIADRFSNWLTVLQLPRDDAACLVTELRRFFTIHGVPENITSDNATVFVSAATQDFLARWGVEHRTSSPYYPRANKRAELAVKHAKRMAMENLGPKGSLDTDKFARALLAHRNTPDPRTGLSPAQIIFGRPLRDHLPAPLMRLKPRAEWGLTAEKREAALAKSVRRMDEHLRRGAKDLPPLPVGASVAIQDPHSDGTPARWSKTGVIVDILPHQTYSVRVDGSRRVTQRHRRFLRQFTPFVPDAPLSGDPPPGPPPGVITRSMTTPEPLQPPTLPPQPLPPQPPAVPPVPALAPPHQTQHVTHMLPRPCLPIDPAHLRLPPAGAPGMPILDRLRTQESSGQLQHLISPTYTSPLHLSRHEGLPQGGGINHTQE